MLKEKKKTTLKKVSTRKKAYKHNMSQHRGRLRNPVGVQLVSAASSSLTSAQHGSKE